MPKIILKPNSPEYADMQKSHKKRSCDIPGCPNHGQHKAPKHRGLNDYYYFCDQHIKEYNKAWDFFSGMSEKEVQEHTKKSLYGDRPTWRYDSEGMTAEEELYKAAQDSYSYESEEESSYNKATMPKNDTPEYEALALMGLNPPITLEEIKTRYKKLAKRYHPDLNKKNKNAEELLKKINMAYTILKLAFQDYTKIKKKQES